MTPYIRIMSNIGYAGDLFVNRYLNNIIYYNITYNKHIIKDNESANKINYTCTIGNAVSRKRPHWKRLIGNSYDAIKNVTIN